MPTKKNKSAFGRDDIPEKAKDYHGMAHYVRTHPDLAAQGEKCVNIEISFHEALALSMAIQSCLTRLNRYNRNTTLGTNMGLSLVLFAASKSITVIEKSVLPANE